MTIANGAENLAEELQSFFFLESGSPRGNVIEEFSVVHIF
jgi:hypothetical protein